MPELQSRIVKLLFTYDWEIVEVQGAIFKMLWGLWLLLPFPAFQRVSAYNQIGGEIPWGVVLVALGTLHFVAIYYNRLFWRRWITFIACLFWIFITVLVVLQIPTAAIIPFFAVIAFFMAVNFIRIGLLMGTEKRIIDLGNPKGQPERRHIKI